MPKIIENVREQLLEEAQKQIRENGYANTTIRSVAKACGLGVGTVYNYFPSKDMLIASFMAEDWNQCLKKMERIDSKDSEVVIRSIYDNLTKFMEKYDALFRDSDATKVYTSVFSVRHKQLRSQLAMHIQPICEEVSVEDKEFLAEWIAESLLTWTVSGKTFEEQYEIIKQFIK